MTNRLFPRLRVVALPVFLAASLLFSDAQADAQNLITTMTAQLAKLELDLQETKKGYAIIQQGLSDIQQIKKGDFDLHSLFFNTLKNVNPAIKNSGKVADIIAMQVQILAGCAKTIQTVTASSSYSNVDLGYIGSVFINLKSLTGEDITELTQLVTDGQWQMSDDERMSRIDQLFLRVTEKYNFMRAFSNRVLLRAQLRSEEKASIQTIFTLIGP